MIGKFVENKEELKKILETLKRSSYGHGGFDSKNHPGFKYWTHGCSENDPRWPVIYWSKRLEAEIRDGE